MRKNFPLLNKQKTFMKFLSVFLLLLFPALAFCQEVMFANSENEPTGLYQKANESLNNGDTKLAMDIFKQVIEFYEEEGRTKEVSESYLGMALAFAFNGNYSESIRFHKKALRAHHKYRPQESDDAIRFNLGLAYQLAGKERKAKKILN